MIEQADNVLYLGELIVANQIALPLFESVAHSILHQESPLKDKYVGLLNVPYKEIAKYENKLIDDDLDVVDFLNVACGLKWNKSKYRGSCRHSTETTYKVFRTLCDLNGRKDIKKDVDIYFNSGGFGTEGHAFLNADTSEGRINYETFGKKVPLLKPEEVRDFSRENFYNMQMLNLDEKPDNIHSSKFGFTYPTVHGLSKKGGSALEIASAVSSAGQQIYKRIRKKYKSQIYFS